MFKKFSLIAVAALFAAISLQAAPWITRDRRVPKNLVVIGNYATPRLMAETIKGLTAQPYVIIVSDSEYVVVLRKAVVKIKAADFGARINKLAPRRVVIIGDDRYVTRAQEEFMRKQLNIKRIPIVRIYGGDWGRVAEELDDLLNIGNLAREFRRNYFTVAMSDSRWAGKAAEKKADNVPASEPAPADNAQDAEDLPVSEPQLPAEK